MMDLCDFSTLIYLSCTMRFSCYLVFSLGIILFPLRGMAAEPVAMASGVSAAPSAAASEQEIQIEAHEIKGMRDEGTEAHGKVELRQGVQKVYAEHVYYKQKTGELTAVGNVRVEQPGATINGPDLKFNSVTSSSEMHEPVFQMQQYNSRGSAKLMRSSDKLHYEYKDAVYTTCPPGNDDWLVKMTTLEIDRETQVGTAYNSRIEFMGVPFLYTPWMDFPLQGRKSGFLAPSWGFTTSSGQEYTIPFYWNIAPNYDATISARHMNLRGTQLNDEFRYMGESYSGKINYDVLQNDQLTNMSRTHMQLEHGQKFGDSVMAAASLSRVGDDAYFRDLSPTAAGTLQTQLLSQGSLSYAAGWGSASMRLQSYQTLQNPLAPVAVPYQRMPQINLNIQKTLNDDFEDIATLDTKKSDKDKGEVGAGAKGVAAKNEPTRTVEIQHPTVVNLMAEYVDFLHPTSVSGQRLVLYPAATYLLLNDPGYYLKPKIGVHYTDYVMGINNSSNIPDATRTIPIFSLDGGVVLERDMELGSGGYTQTLEPRAFYVNIPYQNQDSLPIYDSSLAGFSFAQMFSENRYYGNDRVGDANMLTTALTSRIIDNNGGVERLRVAVGERYNFTAPKIGATSANSQSDILLAVGGRVTDALTLDSLYQYDPNTRYVLSYNASARYSPAKGKVLNLTHRYAFVDGTPQNDLRQGDFSAQWPVFRGWDLVTRWTYSWTERRVLEQMGGIEYNPSCWTLRLVAQKYPIPGQHVATSIMIQLELNDLVAVGTDPLSMLRTEVPGYAKMNQR